MSEYGEITAPDTVRFERLLPGPIERVFSYLVDGEKRALWLASGAMEPRVGARFAMRFRHSELSDEPGEPPEAYKPYEGGIDSPNHRVTQCDPPRLLAFTWDDGETPSEVVFELSEAGDRVRLVLTHRRLPDRAEMRNVAGGWHSHLAVLALRLEGKAPPNFWTLHKGRDAAYAERFAE